MNANINSYSDAKLSRSDDQFDDMLQAGMELADELWQYQVNVPSDATLEMCEECNRIKRCCRRQCVAWPLIIYYILLKLLLVAPSPVYPWAYLLSKTTSHEFAPPVTRCCIPLVTPAACLPMQTRAECGREIPNSLSVSRHRNHITFDSVPKVTRFLKACPPLNRSRCQGWSPLSLASTHKPQTSNVE